MKNLKEVKTALNYMLSSEGKVLERMIGLIYSPNIVSDNIDSLREFIDGKDYNISVKKSYKGFLSNIVTLNNEGLLDYGHCDFSKITTIRKLKESLSFAKKEKVDLSFAIKVKTTNKTADKGSTKTADKGSTKTADKGSTKTADKTTNKSLKELVAISEGKTITLELVKKMKKSDRQSLKEQIIGILMDTDEPLILTQVSQILVDVGMMEI